MSDDTTTTYEPNPEATDAPVSGMGTFAEDGTYTVAIAHAMRNNGNVEGVTKLEGITDVGFSIEGTTKQ